MRVKLDDIIEQFELATESSQTYLNRITGEIHLIPEEVELYVENEEFDEDDLPEWEKEIVQVYKDVIENPEHYIQFPDQFYVDEYSVMERFSLSLTNEKMRNILYSSLNGKGAFRRFKDTANELGILEDWYKYKDKAIKELAIEWCKENNLEFY